MKIGIDIRSTLKQRTGIGQYILSLINHLAKIDLENKYFLYSKKKIIDRKRKLPKLPGQNFSHRIDYFSFGPDKLLKDVDIYHTSSFDLKPPQRCQLVLTVQDVINKAYPKGHTQDTIKTIDRQLKEVLPLAKRIVVDSECTKRDLLKWYPVDERIVRIVYPGVNPWFSWQDVKKQDIILFVGTIEPRKNIENLIRAFDILKKQYHIAHKLMIIGMKGWMCEGVFSLVKELKLTQEVIFKDFIANENLAAWYSQAQVFVYPSFYEGFGFPIVEAFASGVPVVTSNVSSCQEIAGEAALLVDPQSVEQLKDAILRLLEDKSLRESLINKGFVRAKSFSWERAAKEVFSVYKEALGAG
ncbi:MAG: glycosyltransferase family 1 protein [Candidatus Omnitrophota bacterium]|nr:glycosyltransferase family 1 protein [Candidatus Omnitrophota bacterium]